MGLLSCGFEKAIIKKVGEGVGVERGEGGRVEETGYAFTFAD